MSIIKGKVHYDDSSAYQAIKIDASQDALFMPIYKELKKTEKLTPQTMISLGLEDWNFHGYLKLNPLEFAISRRMNKSELQRCK